MVNVHPDLLYEMIQAERTRELALAEHRRDALLAIRRPSLRARVARTLFRAAFAVEAEEVWRSLWESLSAGGNANSRAEVSGRRALRDR